jgi:hypothetical protein
MVGRDGRKTGKILPIVSKSSVTCSVQKDVTSISPTLFAKIAIWNIFLDF